MTPTVECKIERQKNCPFPHAKAERTAENAVLSKESPRNCLANPRVDFPDCERCLIDGPEIRSELRQYSPPLQPPQEFSAESEQIGKIPGLPHSPAINALLPENPPRKIDQPSSQPRHQPRHRLPAPTSSIQSTKPPVDCSPPKQNPRPEARVNVL
jgi:hypothetical protein